MSTSARWLAHAKMKANARICSVHLNVCVQYHMLVHCAMKVSAWILWKFSQKLGLIQFWFCFSEMDPCKSYPCNNNGKCRFDAKNMTINCECPRSYTGEHCDTSNRTINVSLNVSELTDECGNCFSLSKN